jgi:cyclophilin family peptidyl-prolyl cis-trans isomerase
MVQCGDPTATGGGGPGYTIADELPAAGSYKIGSLAMANAGANTGGSQYFLITGQNGVSLPSNYALFGQVTDGLDTTVRQLDAAGNPDPQADGVPPMQQIVIQSVTINET